MCTGTRRNGRVPVQISEKGGMVGLVGLERGSRRLAIVLPTFDAEVGERWRASLPFFLMGALGIIGGGVAAAVTRPTDWHLGSWCAAFLVLVVGVAQIGLGAGQAALSPTAATRSLVLAEFLAWNLGSAAVIVGTLVDSPAVVSIGSIVFLAAIALATFGARGHSGLTGRARLLLHAFRALLVLLLVSTPIGIVLSWLRH